MEYFILSHPADKNTGKVWSMIFYSENTPTHSVGCLCQHLTMITAKNCQLWMWYIVSCSAFYRAMHYSAKRGLAIACRLSVTLVHHDHIGWKSWKLIAQTISATSSLFVAQRSSTYFQGTWRNFMETRGRACLRSLLSLSVHSCVMCDRDTIQFVMLTVWVFTFVGASRGHLCNSTAFVLNSITDEMG